MTEAPPFRSADPVTDPMSAFLTGIGMPALAADLPERRFVPGIRPDRGHLSIDAAPMPRTGAALHEGGHGTVMTPAVRAGKAVDAGEDVADEIAAVAWSWAALTQLGLHPAAMSHPSGSKGASPWLIEARSAGHRPGLPSLRWMGFAFDERAAAEHGAAPFPHMRRWLREHPRDAAA